MKTKSLGHKCMDFKSWVSRESVRKCFTRFSSVPCNYNKAKFSPILVCPHLHNDKPLICTFQCKHCYEIICSLRLLRKGKNNSCKSEQQYAALKKKKGSLHNSELPPKPPSVELPSPEKELYLIQAHFFQKEYPRHEWFWYRPHQGQRK